MTRREPVETKLILGIILPLYKMIDEDIEALRLKLTDQMVIEYRQTIQGQLTLYGCQKTVTGPDDKSQRWIDAYARKNSERIARTYNRELNNQIQRMYAANPRGNRNYYYKGLEAWNTKRNAWKLPSIALNTAQAIRKYAKDRFRIENNISGRYILVGPPPTCEICIRIKALGVVDEKTMINNPLPAHIGCPHEWEEVIPKKIDCSIAWTG